MREEVPPTVSKPALGWLANKDNFSGLISIDAVEIGTYIINSFNANRHIAFEEEVIW